MLNLLSSQSRVEAPFIVVSIAGYTFGNYSKQAQAIIDSTGIHKKVLTQYPNFIQSLNIKKINGQVNQYTLTMVYGIQAGDDPNMLEKVFSLAKNDRRITFTYGDVTIPDFMYRNEEATITDVRSDVNINGSITYTISATSNALTLASGSYSFPAQKAKPSDVIKKLLYNKGYGLLDVFKGMVDKDLVLSRGLIASDDKEVKIEAKTSISPIAYLNYLISCMISISNVGDKVIQDSRYAMKIVDDTSGEFGGSYFKIVKITNVNSNNADLFEIDVGFPGQSLVTSFSIDDKQTYSILYDYSLKAQLPDYVYRIDNQGNTYSEYSPVVSNSSTLMKTTAQDKSWWTQMTQYPITVTLTVQGLLRPAILLSTVKLNVLFYGKKHISSGVYAITEQIDSVDRSGYRTTLKLLRVAGE